MNVFQAIIQGIVQGATEFLPVSSSGHLSLIQHIMGVSLQSLLFDVILHAGTLVAVIAVYFKQILKLLKEFFLIIRDIFTGRFSVKNMNPYRRMVIMLIISLIPLFLLFLPVPGMADTKLKDLSDKWSTDTNIMVEGFSFLLTSILLFWGVSSNRKFNSKHYSASNHFNDRKTGVRNYMLLPDAVCIGIVQVFAALLPGLSRSGSTISTGLIRGIDKKTSVDYSFLLGIPSILAAAVLLMKDSQMNSAL
jgi:undecaprenyl-diphosphatase